MFDAAMRHRQYSGLLAGKYASDFLSLKLISHCGGLPNEGYETSISGQRVGLLAYIKSRGITKVFPIEEQGLMNEWVDWTYGIGTQSRPTVEDEIRSYGEVPFYVYVSKGTSAGSVSVLAFFDKFQDAPGNQYYEGKQLKGSFHFTRYQWLDPPLSLADFTNWYTDAVIRSPTVLRKHYIYVIDPIVQTARGLEHKPDDGSKKRSARLRRRMGQTTHHLAGEYLRATQSQLSVIKREHDLLANRLQDAFRGQGVSKPVMEENYVDLSFVHEGLRYMFEVKITRGLSTTHAIREAIGQVLEYNYYCDEEPSNEWVIILDQQPTELDKAYIRRLRLELGIPLNIGWQGRGGFEYMNPVF